MKHAAEPRRAIRHVFVEFVPAVLEPGVLYVSICYTTAVHACCCGCGREVVTPLTPTDWILSFDGETVSLDPSIGNWSFPCRSHYWITRDRVEWAPTWTSRQIERGRCLDAARKQERTESHAHEGTSGVSAPSDTPSRFEPLWHRFLRWLGG